ncbi:MAG TPA: LacI family DNA-binding transcriptional regulator [Spirochaetales bacterium]|nr:LacI family DNA-binding transcriptional regulator [Spirochaetales bacterium]HRY55573.1 LacI family DNA-binding transcriptional regulator [Spirochaetia bacterium]HRZ65384.1 LacI family DNA-binding transcriptional regulator [Spirochaetia bacterium]
MCASDCKPITLKHIADLAGVSVSTVSRSLNGTSRISEATRQRIRSMAEELGFEFNASARSLITKQVGTIGVVLPPSYEEFGVNLYFNTLFNAIRAILERNDYDLIVAFPANRFTGQDNLRRLVTRRKVDGLIVMSPRLEPELLEFVRGSGMPFVFSHYPPPEGAEAELDFIYPDNELGGYLAARHLASLGRRRTFCLTSDADYELEYRLRLQGARRALAESGLSIGAEDILYGDMSIESGYRAVMNFRRSLGGYDSLLAFDDLMAIGALQAFAELGIAVPGEVSVVGYDDCELSGAMRPALSSVHQPREEMSLVTCERLMGLIEARRQGLERPPARRSVLRPELVVRESCGARSRGAGPRA